jgi:dTDP-4-amino-4,6-dideoxygalactose transaminase
MSATYRSAVRLRRHTALSLDLARLGGWFLTHGRTSLPDGNALLRDFERRFGELTGSSYALATNSGTAALHSAYFAVGVGPGSEVIVPTYTWHASATPVLQCGAVPVFCDVDPHTLTLDVRDMQSRITERTRAICVVHLWGNPAALDAVLEIARVRGIAVIEDCSHAHGAAYRDRPVGAWGDVGCFSLHASKPVAGGEAGVAVTDDPVLMDRMVLLGHVGRTRSGEAMHALGAEDDLGITDLGVKYRAHGFAVHLARSQLGRLARENARRARVWEAIRGELHGSPVLLCPETLEGAQRGGYYRYVIRYTGDAPLAALVSSAQARGVPVEVEMYGQNLLHEAPVFRTLERARLGGGCFDPTRERHENVARESLPVAERTAPRVLAFDQLIHLAGPRYAARSARALRRVAEELSRV